MDNIMITRVWQDDWFFKVEVRCKTKFIDVIEKVYTQDSMIDDLCNKLDAFLSGKVESACWKNGERGDGYSPCIELQFLHKDKCGHILIDVFMEIDDGGSLETHNCCFYLNTELGLLYRFREKLLNLKTQQLGVQVALSEDESDC